MSIPRSSLRRHALATAALLALAAVPAHAQRKQSVSVNASNDSTSFVVARTAPTTGQPSAVTRDGTVALILEDTAVVIQMTDDGMRHLFDSDTTARSGGAAIFAHMIRTGVSDMMDHGIAYRLSALRRAYADGGAVVLVDAKGEHVFANTEFNGRHPMENFAPADAARFAAEVQRRIAAGR